MHVSLTREVKIPTRANIGDAGLDIYIPKFTPEFVSAFSDKNRNPSRDAFIDMASGQINIHPGGKVFIPTGLKFSVPKNTMLMVANKGGYSWNNRVSCLAEIIDESFQGEVFISLYNIQMVNTVLLTGDKFIQLVCVPILYPEVEIVDESEIHQKKPTERGAGSFGSTGN